ncbi:MAG: BMP family ABC transporter substrate-binding protein [Candidatus Poribacteria bacterium]|nr:BMP family ABC transporter substrate-binding protein [Candidatus Poribacteria bacterium]
MNSIKIVFIPLILCILFLTLCGCERIQDVLPTDMTNELESGQLKVTMIYPNDCVGSAAYCTSFHIGVRIAVSELGIMLTEVNGMENDPVATEMIMRDAAQNSDLVITAGYQMGDILNKVAPEFPDVKFAIFDVVLDMPNVAAVNYKSNEGSFLVGAIAALKTETGKIGYIGGVDVPLLQEFEAGYIAGIQTINPETEIFVDYISDDVTGFIQPEKAKELALAQYASGVDVIYTAAGGSGQGVLEAAQETQKFIIWVDSNGNHLAPGIVLTSMAKEIPASVVRIIQETLDDNFMYGIRYFGLEDGGVYYAVDEHNQSLLSDEIITKVESLKVDVIAGDIIVPDTISLPRQ